MPRWRWRSAPASWPVPSGGGELKPLPAIHPVSGVSSEVPDWSREARRPFAWQPAQALMGSIRAYQKVRGKRDPISTVRRVMAVLRHRFWSVVTGADIPLNCQIGGGLRMPHPIGIVVHPDVVMGPNCQLMQHVTLGIRGGGVPKLGGHVDVSVGASILGPVTIGDHAVIGAHALVVKDVPPGAVVIAPLGVIRNEDQAD